MLQQPHIIGIGGLKRSGKDTFARILAEVARERGLAPVILAFADPVRQAAAAAYGVDVSSFTDDARKDTICEAWGVTYRQMLINLGEAMRDVDADHWAKAWRRAVVQRSRTRESDKPLLVLVPDLRRVNEVQAIHDAGGLTVLMRRPGVEWNGHETEVLAHLAQHRDDAKAGALGLWYADDNAMSLHYNPTTPGAPMCRLFYDIAIDNPVAVGAQAIADDIVKLRSQAVAVLSQVRRGL